MSETELDAARRVAARHTRLELAQLAISDSHELTRLRTELAELRESIEEWADELTWADGLCETPAKMRQALARHQEKTNV